jgi:predicted membrane protein
MLIIVIFLFFILLVLRSDLLGQLFDQLQLFLVITRLLRTSPTKAMPQASQTTSYLLFIIIFKIIKFQLQLKLP